MSKLSYASVTKRLALLIAQAAKIEASRSAIKKKSVAKVTALMKRLGVSIADLQATDKTAKKLGRKTGKKSANAGKTVAVKYRHPESGLTWSGRGVAPRWLAGEIASGKAKEEFLVQAVAVEPAAPSQ